MKYHLYIGGTTTVKEFYTRFQQMNQFLSEIQDSQLMESTEAYSSLAAGLLALVLRSISLVEVLEEVFLLHLALHNLALVSGPHGQLKKEWDKM